MPKITNILFKPEKQRYWIYVDGNYCTSIRERTFPALNLKIGDEISCEEIKERENYFFKHSYSLSWGKEKIRLEKVRALIEQTEPLAITRVIGFGADSTELIAEHPSESGKPDIEILLRNILSNSLMLIEVSGTERMRGNSYWVRPDKLKYAESHPEEDVWIILHFAEPAEHFVFIKPKVGKQYQRAEKIIRDATEYYVEFLDNSEEVKSEEEFFSHLKYKINQYSVS